MKRALAIALVLAPLAARAAPPHSVVEVKPGDTTFVRLYEVRVVTSLDPAVATVEHLPSDELLVTGKKAGTTDLVALTGGKLVGIRVHVRAPGTAMEPDPSAARLEAAQKACPKLRLVGEGKDQELGVTPQPAACRSALEALFATDRFLIKQISVDFDGEALQTQIAQFDAALKAVNVPVELHYQGATLVLKGSVDLRGAERLIGALYAHAVGGVPLDDDDLEIEAPDAGSPPEHVPASGR